MKETQFDWSMRIGSSVCYLCHKKQYRVYYVLYKKCVCETCFRYAHALFEQGELFKHERIYMKLNRILFGD